MAALSFKKDAPLLEYRKTSAYVGSNALSEAPKNVEYGYDEATGIVAKWTRPVNQGGDLIDLTAGTANMYIIAAWCSFLNRILHSRVLLDCTMLCDVISAMTEFMGRALHSRVLFDCTLAKFKPACM
jgi:hypothetical protein